MQELSNDPLNILRPASKLQHSLNLASAYCGPPENQENENRRGRRHDARPHEPKVSTACTLCYEHPKFMPGVTFTLPCSHTSVLHMTPPTSAEQMSLGTSFHSRDKTRGRLEGCRAFLQCTFHSSNTGRRLK